MRFNTNRKISVNSSANKMSIITSIIIVSNTKRNARCVTMTIFFRHYTENSSCVKISVDFKKCFPLKKVNLRRK